MNRTTFKHAGFMKRFSGMKHDEPHMAHVHPGKSSAIVWRALSRTSPPHLVVQSRHESEAAHHHHR